MNNPIIDEIREARAALAAEHGYDLVRINEWARQQSAARQPNHQTKANKALLATDGAAKSPVTRKRRVRPTRVSV